MVDLSPIKSYIEDKNENDCKCAEIVIEDRGFDNWFKDHINVWLNCSFVSKNGNRIIQTNDKRYNYELTCVVYMIEKYGGDDKDYYYNELINRHFNNLEFERINGYAYDPYSTTKKKSTTSRKKTKQTSLDFGDKPKKETAAEKKLKAHAAKISMLTFKIKPANGNNTL